MKFDTDKLKKYLNDENILNITQEESDYYDTVFTITFKNNIVKTYYIDEMGGMKLIAKGEI